MQEVKLNVVPNDPSNVARVLHQYISQGFHIDVVVVDSKSNMQNQTITTVVSRVGE